MAEILFSPNARSGSFAVNVPGRSSDEAQAAEADADSYLQEHLRLTRERILRLRGAFEGLQKPPLPTQTAATDGRGTTNSAVGFEFHARLITASNTDDPSADAPKGLAVNVVV